MTFNKYVNPGSGVHFKERCVAVHGIHPSDPRITEADKLAVVWGQFCEWLEKHTASDEVGILVAYNGENCDMKWLWKITGIELDWDGDKESQRPRWMRQ